MVRSSSFVGHLLDCLASMSVSLEDTNVEIYLSFVFLLLAGRTRSAVMDGVLDNGATFAFLLCFRRMEE